MKKIMIVLLLGSVNGCYATIDPCVGMAASGIMCMAGCMVAMQMCTERMRQQIHQHHTHGHSIERQTLVGQPQQQSTAPTTPQQQRQGQDELGSGE